MTYKQPVSVLVLVYTEELDVLLLERADFPGHWQSVTGSREAGEPLAL
ncbi:MAG: NUDIX domain-containing protein, partial [Betaproteobacteria bacterium]|nr:NUDIX domain-containing protein [Betaproteobacteria bacterium]